jgi:hypothetical protein
MVFNPNSHITKIKGKDYLEVKWRIAWMRDQNPTWGIDTIPMQVGGVLVVKAIITNEDGRQMASGLATVREAASNRESWSGREFEKAETAALGRALAVAGYGTQFTNDFDEGEYLSDSPVQPKQNPPPKPSQDIPEGTKRNVTIVKRIRRSVEKGNPPHHFRTSELDGSLLVKAYSRQPFIEKFYCTENDWLEVDVVEELRFTCGIIMSKYGWWGFDFGSLPPYDPGFDALGNMSSSNPEDIPL